jgi:hypothetical protein
LPLDSEAQLAQFGAVGSPGDARQFAGLDLVAADVPQHRLQHHPVDLPAHPPVEGRLAGPQLLRFLKGRYLWQLWLCLKYRWTTVVCEPPAGPGDLAH